MGSINKHGLSRNIPEDIKREVRRRCGFGCVVCGVGIIEYEHVEPEFKDCIEHDSNNIVLLCPSCHSRVTRKFWNKDAIKLASKNPKCLQTGFTGDIFTFTKWPSIVLGGAWISGVAVPISIKGNPLFIFEPPEDEGQPFRVSAFFLDNTGSQTLRILRNEWVASSENWDLEYVGGRLRIYESKKTIKLDLEVGDAGVLHVRYLDMVLGNWNIIANESNLLIRSLDGRYQRYISNCTYHGVGFHL